MNIMGGHTEMQHQLRVVVVTTAVGKVLKTNMLHQVQKKETIIILSKTAGMGSTAIIAM